MSQIRLRYSDNGGGDWGLYMSQEIGQLGDYDRVYQWTRLGMARDRVFEISWTGDRPLAVNGAFVDTEGMQK